MPNPDELLGEFFRILKPGGLMLSSSMKPDSDISEIFTSYIGKVRGRELKKDSNRDRDLNAARNMLNEASSLFQLEEDGYFRFYTAEELRHLVESAGFAVTQCRFLHGKPAASRDSDRSQAGLTSSLPIAYMPGTDFAV